MTLLTVDELLSELARRDVALSVQDGRLLFDAPAGAVTDELRAAIAGHRAELVRRLAAANTSPGRPRIDFSRWVYRPAADGTPGWESLDMPQSSRWWARQAWLP